MRSIIDGLLTKLNILRSFATSCEAVYKTLKRHKQAEVRACLNIRKRLDYTAFMISLYGIFEKFVEDLVWSYTEITSSQQTYSQLSDKLRSKHLHASAELLMRGRLGEGRYNEISELEVVTNLYTCLSGTNPYKLNKHAVIQHNNNLQSEIIKGIFTHLGVDNINWLACQTDSMINWFSATQGIDPPTENASETIEAVIDLRLKDLVERRNQIAHGGELVSSIDLDDMGTKLTFLEAYSNALFDALVSTYFKRLTQSEAVSSLGKPIEGPYKNNSVVVVKKPVFKLFRGQPLFGLRDGRIARWGEILELRIDDDAVEDVEANSSATAIGVKSRFKFTEGMELYVINDPLKALWDKFKVSSPN